MTTISIHSFPLFIHPIFHLSIHLSLHLIYSCLQLSHSSCSFSYTLTCTSIPGYTARRQANTVQLSCFAVTHQALSFGPPAVASTRSRCINWFHILFGEENPDAAFCLSDNRWVLLLYLSTLNREGFEVYATLRSDSRHDQVLIQEPGRSDEVLVLGVGSLLPRFVPLRLDEKTSVLMVISGSPEGTMRIMNHLSQRVARVRSTVIISKSRLIPMARSSD